MSETLTPIVQTDARGRAVLSGHRNQRFIMTDQSDGSVLLVPAVVVSQAQSLGKRHRVGVVELHP